MNMKLKELRISKGINQEKLASYCNVSRSTVAMWETNKAQPDIETLKKLAEYFETSIDYLTGRTDYTDFENETICENLKTYLGKGTFMYQNDGRTYYPNYEATRSIIKGTYKFTKDSLSIYLDAFNLTEADLLESKKENPIFSSGKKGIKIPVLGEVRAGIPVEAVQDIIDYEEITEDMASLGSYFGLQIKGSSMEPKFSDGDVVIVKKQTTAETGDIVIAMVNGDEATVKKFKRMDNGIMLVPTNPNFEAMFYTNEEVEKKPITILGKVVELRAKF